MLLLLTLEALLFKSNIAESMTKGKKNLKEQWDTLVCIFSDQKQCKCLILHIDVCHPTVKDSVIDISLNSFVITQ